jgi:hypothetical protein
MPDVALARRPGVELVRTGRFQTLTGSWNPTPADIKAAVEAMDCPAIRKPVIRIGHTDRRFVGDGEPALGWFENLRAADGGHTLVADQVTLPWLHSVQAAAYPSRSIEGNYNHRCSEGHTHRFVIHTVALLGVTPPGVQTLRSLNDLPGMLGVAASGEVPEGARHVQVTVHASAEHVFDEHKHKRDGNGKFAHTAGSGLGHAAKGGDKPLTGVAAHDAPPLKLADLPKDDPRAEALWFRTGDNSMETRDYPGFVRLNDYMRNGGSDPKMAGYVEGIDKAMAESKLPAPIQVYRGIEASAIGDPGNLEGVEFTDKAFASTTTDAVHAKAFGSTMTITVPAGVSAITMADRDPGLPESEILLDRGLRYRVVKETLVMGEHNIPERHDIEVEVVSAGDVKAAADSAKPGEGKRLSPDDLMRAKYVWAAGDVEVLGKEVSAAAGEEPVHTGAMVALMVAAEDASRLAIEGGEAADELHLTLAYLGEAADLGVTGQQDIIDAVSTAINGMPTVDATAFAVTAFNPGAQFEADTCLVYGVTGDFLDTVHDFVMQAIDESSAGTRIPPQILPWVAHVTAAYTDDLGRLSDLAAKLGPVRFDRVRLAFAGQYTDIPLIDWDEEPDDPSRIADDDGMVAAAAGGTAELKKYWLSGPGLAKWADKPHPWTALYKALRKYIKDPDEAKRTASQWYRLHFGHIPNQGVKASEAPDLAPAPDLPAAELRKEVQILASQMKNVSDELAATKAEKAATVKASVIQAAFDKGKFKAHEREQWETDYDEAPGAVTRILASIADGTAVPVMASGTVGSAEPELGNDDEWNQLVARLDGPNAKAV